MTLKLEESREKEVLFSNNHHF